METKNTFLKILDKIDAGIKRMRDYSNSVRMLYEAGNIDAANEQAFKLEEKAEKTVLLTRVLPAYSGRRSADVETNNLIANSISVEIGFTSEGWFVVRIPALLPKKDSGSVDYIRSFLYPAMRSFFDRKVPVRFKDCVLVFRHEYDRSRPERQMRDHDNIEVNMVADIVAMYVLPDDNPSFCSHYYCSAAASEDRTEIYVIPRYDFPLWFAQEKLTDMEVLLYETI